MPAREFCTTIGLPWPDAVRLHHDGFLSFDPEDPERLDEARQSELQFLGTLVRGGCSRALLRALLRSLREPYSYDLRRIYFDWEARRWRLLPGEGNPEECFFALLERLRTRDERAVLLDIRDWLDEAFDLARGRTAVFVHEGVGAADDGTDLPPERRPGGSGPRESAAG